MCGQWRNVNCILGTSVLVVLLVVVAGCGSKGTSVHITNKITSLPAGQTYVFTVNVQNDPKAGITPSLTGAGTLVLNGETAIYVALPVPPNPNSVTVKLTAANGSGASDSDTFTITPAAGSVVSISPAQSSVSVSAGTPVILNIAVIQDQPIEVLTASISSSSSCGSDCGSLSAISGTPGSGIYTVQFSPPSSTSASTLAVINVASNLANSTQGTAFVTIKP